jgi:integrase
MLQMKRKERLNNTLVDNLQATGSDYRVWDTVTSNLNVRVTPAGAKTYYLFYRNSDRLARWLKLGKPPAMSVEQARQLARSHQFQIDLQHDPFAEREDRLRDPDMTKLWAAYLDQHALPKKGIRSIEEDKRLWRLHIAPTLGRAKVRSVSVADIRSLHAGMRHKHGAANRMRSLLSKMMNLAIENEWRDSNPCRFVQKYPEKAKQRYLSRDEIVRLLETLESDVDRCAATIIKVLLLTGARKSEIMNMRWCDLSLDGEQPTWTLRAGQQKGERSFQTDTARPLDIAVAKLLSEWRTQLSVVSLEWVFPSERKVGTPRRDIKYAWNRIRSKASLLDVRIHDLRHTYASIAVNAGVPLAIVGKTMGHKTYKTTERYVHLTDESQRKAVCAVSTSVLSGI